MPRPRQILAYSGVLRTDSDPGGTFALAEHAVGLAGRDGQTRVCYVPTAVGDSPLAVEAFKTVASRRPDIDLSVLTLFNQPSVPDVREHLLGQDVIVVEGGSVVNLMAVWRAHGLRQIMRECWDAGVVLAGGSAGSLCWHLGGPTDSFRDALDPFTDGIGLLPYSNGVHDDLGEQPRRETYRRMIAEEVLPAGYATEDGVGLHYLDTTLHEAVTIRSGKRAWWVQQDGNGGFAADPVQARRI
jgi:peptidase E